MAMNASNTAIVLIGYQNDYFAEGGVLHGVIKESLDNDHVLDNTLDLVRRAPEGVPIVATPIAFSEDYAELDSVSGILALVKEVGAFKKNHWGSETIEEFDEFNGKITEVPGKISLNAFHNTDLDKLLRDKGVENVVIGGAICAVCIDSTGRSASERGFDVTILGDCLSGRSALESDFYKDQIFPLYAGVQSHDEVLSALH